VAAAGACALESASVAVAAVVEACEALKAGVAGDAADASALAIELARDFLGML